MIMPIWLWPKNVTQISVSYMVALAAVKWIWDIHEKRTGGDRS